MRMFTSWIPWLPATGIRFPDLTGGATVERLQTERCSRSVCLQVSHNLLRVRALQEK